MGDRASLDDPRGLLIFEYFRVVKETRPRAFIYENVPGLKSAVDNNGKKVVQIVSRICNQLGYTIYAKMLHSDNYGVPQSRKRLFIVGFRNDLNVFGFEFPRPIPLKVRLLDLCEPEVDEKYYLSEKGIKFITNNMRQKKGFTSINPDISLPLTHKGQANWTGSFIEDVDLNPKVKINPEISTTLGCNQYKNSDGTFIAPELTQVGHIGNANSRGNRVYDPNGLATSIMGNAGGGGGKTGLYIVGYTRKGKDISYHLKDKSNTLKTPAGNTQQYLAEGKRIRRLTPRETFRLQGVDDFL
jgi:DNA-cytosine methyltransferase